MERGIECGMQQGMQQGEAKATVAIIENYIKKNNATLQIALEVLDISMEDYENAKDIIAKYV